MTRMSGGRGSPGSGAMNWTRLVRLDLQRTVIRRESRMHGQGTVGGHCREIASKRRSEANADVQSSRHGLHVAAVCCL